MTFKYSESAQSALAEPNKKIDGRQTHCNYACERSNVSGGVTPNNNHNNDSRSINSPNSNIGSSSNLMGSSMAQMRNDQSSRSQRSQQSIQSLTSPSMNMSGLSNQSVGGNNHNSHPSMSTFGSNPLSLNPSSLSHNLSSGRGGSSMNTLSNNMGTGMNGIDISSLSSIPNIAYRPNQMGQNKSNSPSIYSYSLPLHHN